MNKTKQAFIGNIIIFILEVFAVILLITYSITLVLWKLNRGRGKAQAPKSGVE